MFASVLVEIGAKSVDKLFTYIIPNTNIRAHVVASSGSVTFYDNTTN